MWSWCGLRQQLVWSWPMPTWLAPWGVAPSWSWCGLRQQLDLSWPRPIWLAPKGAGPSGGRSSSHRPMVWAAARGALVILTNLRVGWSGRVGGSA